MCLSASNVIDFCKQLWISALFFRDAAPMSNKGVNYLVGNSKGQRHPHRTPATLWSSTRHNWGGWGRKMQQCLAMCKDRLGESSQTSSYTCHIIIQSVSAWCTGRTLLNLPIYQLIHKRAHGAKALGDTSRPAIERKCHWCWLWSLIIVHASPCSIELWNYIINWLFSRSLVGVSV
jgi:hypothetical protein